MDKETIVNFCNSEKKSSLVALEIIASYCEDMGKKVVDIQLFIHTLQGAPMFILEYLEVALNYYKRKYVVTDLYNGDKFIKTF